MASVNKVILVGNLGLDPETRYMPDGSGFTTLSLATTDKWKDKSGEKKEATEWHRVVLSGKLSEIAAEYLKKGAAVYIEGSLRTRKWTDKNGIEKYTTEIRGQSLQMLGHKQTANDSQAPETKKPFVRDSMFDDMPDDIPF